MSRKPSQADVSRRDRVAEKEAAREHDGRLLESGVAPEELQRRNAAFPVGMFVGARIENLASAVGR